MTSEANDAATRACFEEHGYFGLEPDGRALLPPGDGPGPRRGRAHPDAAPRAGRSSPRTATAARSAPSRPRGPSTDARARASSSSPTSRSTTRWRGRPIRSSSACTRSRGAGMSSKVVAKHDAAREGRRARRGPTELLGCIEYSDLPAELRDARDPDGQLAYRAGNIALHVLALDFLEELDARRPPAALARGAQGDARARRPAGPAKVRGRQVRDLRVRRPRPLAAERGARGRARPRVQPGQERRAARTRRPARGPTCAGCTRAGRARPGCRCPRPPPTARSKASRRSRSTRSSPRISSPSWNSAARGRRLAAEGTGTDEHRRNEAGDHLGCARAGLGGRALRRHLDRARGLAGQRARRRERARGGPAAARGARDRDRRARPLAGRRARALARARARRARRRRRLLPRPARRRGRGRHAPGPARELLAALHRLGRARLGPVHGQAGAARHGGRRGPARGAGAWPSRPANGTRSARGAPRSLRASRPSSERAPWSSRAGAAPRWPRPSSRPARASSRAPWTRRSPSIRSAWSRPSSPASRSPAACSGTPSRSPRASPRSRSAPLRGASSTTSRSTTRAAPSSSARRRA